MLKETIPDSILKHVLNNPMLIRSKYMGSFRDALSAFDNSILSIIELSMLDEHEFVGRSDIWDIIEAELKTNEEQLNRYKLIFTKAEMLDSFDDSVKYEEEFLLSFFNSTSNELPDLGFDSLLSEIHNKSGFSKYLGFHSMLSAMSFYAHKLSIESPLGVDVHPNLMMVALAEPSSGKGYYEKIFFQVATRIEIESASTFFFENPTIPGILQVFSEGTDSGIVLTDEGAAFLGGWQFQENRKNSAFGQLCRIYDTHNARIQKQSERITLPDIYLSISMGVQPALWKNISEGMLEQGALSRFLILTDTSERNAMMWGTKPINFSVFNDIAKKVFHLHNEVFSAFTVLEAARELYIQYISDTLKQSKIDSERHFYSKFEKSLLKLSLIMAVWSGKQVVDVESVEKAIKIQDFYIRQVKLTLDKERREDDFLYEWICSRGMDITVREILQKYPKRHIRTSKVLTPLLRDLEDKELITIEKIGTKKVIRVC